MSTIDPFMANKLKRRNLWGGRSEPDAIVSELQAPGTGGNPNMHPVGLLGRIIDERQAAARRAEAYKEKEMIRQAKAAAEAQKAKEMQSVASALMQQDGQLDPRMYTTKEAQEAIIKSIYDKRKIQEEGKARSENRAFELEKEKRASQREIEKEKRAKERETEDYYRKNPSKARDAELGAIDRELGSENPFDGNPGLREKAESRKKLLEAERDKDQSRELDKKRSTVRAEKDEEQALKREESIRENASAASDARFGLNNIKSLIESGKLTNLNTSKFGQGVQTALAMGGFPNNSDAVGQYVQQINKQMLASRQMLKGQGQISNYEQKILSGAQDLTENDTMESFIAKQFVADQILKRAEDVAELQDQWIKRYGSTTKLAENGKSFRDVTTALYKQNPLISYEDNRKQEDEAAMKAELERQQSAQQPSNEGPPQEDAPQQQPAPQQPLEEDKYI